MEPLLKILYLEENKSNAEWVNSLLQKSGLRFECLLTSNKAGFREALDTFMPDAVFSNDLSEKFTNAEALEITRKHCASLPFFMLSEIIKPAIPYEEGGTAVSSRVEKLPAAIETRLRQIQAKSTSLWYQQTDENKTIRDLEDLERKLLQQRTQETRKISRAIIKAREEERNHIGKELHDNINQILAGMRLYLNIASKSNDEIKELLNYPLELLDTAIEEIRKLSSKYVSALQHIDLRQMIGELLNNLEKSNAFKSIFEYNVPRPFTDDELKLNIFRIIQELVNNIVKHAEAGQVRIRIRDACNVITIKVTDDGKGFNAGANRQGIGLSNILDRAESFNGTLHIDSAIGKGCSITVTLPSEDTYYAKA